MVKNINHQKNHKKNMITQQPFNKITTDRHSTVLKIKELSVVTKI